MPPLPLRLLLAAAAGVVVAVSFEPFALFYLMPLGVAGLSLVVRGQRPGSGFLLGTTFGTSFMLALLPWLQVIGTDAWLALSVFQGLFYGLLGLGTALVQRLAWWPLWTAMMWVAIEALRSTVPFGGFPWGRLAFATADTPASGLFAYVGSAGTTFAVALIGSGLAWAVLETRRTPLRGMAAVALPVLVASFAGVVTPWAPAAGEQPRRVVSVAAVQGNVPGEGMDAFAERRAVLNNHVQATRDLADRIEQGAPRPDLVIWPENSTDIDPFADPTVYADIQGAVDAVDVPVLVGAMVSGEQPEDVFNQGIVWRPDEGPAQRYSKNHPVPFGEYIPFRDVFAPYIERLDQIPRDMVPGTAPGLLTLGGTTIGDLICFEVAYDELLHDVVEGGAELVVVQTNNATYMGTGQIEQQFAISRLRAIETNRYVVVAATNGVSGIIGPDGEVVQRAPVRSQSVLREDLPVYATTTPALRWAPVVELLFTAGALISASLAVLLNYRRRRAPAEADGDGPQPAVYVGAGEV
ncbi:MAG TPA: apolipoprotein N-acyltransferase [Nocardioidaceae bacterium]|nr:apolipoprotein N-acyltransferase [Nocardioidaceae bacterium]